MWPQVHFHLVHSESSHFLGVKKCQTWFNLCDSLSYRTKENSWKSYTPAGAEIKPEPVPDEKNKTDPDLYGVNFIYEQLQKTSKWPHGCCAHFDI